MTETISPETVVDEDTVPVVHEPVPDEADDGNGRELDQGEGESDEPSGRRPPSSEKAVGDLEKKLVNERTRHAKKLGDVLGDASTDALPCPLCFDGLMGFVLPGDLENLTEQQTGILRTILGVDEPGQLRPAEGVEECPRCAGFGQLQYPTKNPHMATQTCPKCTGNGYVMVQQPQPAWMPETSNATNAAQTFGPVHNGEPRDHWGRPVGHPHYGRDPVTVGA